MSRRKIDPDRLAECAARGMTMADAARELGVSVPGVFYAARREGVVFPSYREALARPEVKARHAEATREALARPEVKARHAEALARPEVKAKMAAAARARWADPRFNRLAALTPEEREDYDIMKRVGGQRPDDALRAIGRADLIREAAE